MNDLNKIEKEICESQKRGMTDGDITNNFDGDQVSLNNWQICIKNEGCVDKEGKENMEHLNQSVFVNEKPNEDEYTIFLDQNIDE